MVPLTLSKSQKSNGSTGTVSAEVNWISVSIYCDKLEVEAGGQRDIGSFPVGSIESRIIDLISQSAPEKDKSWTKSVFQSLLRKRRCVAVVDCYPSPYFGGRTRRMNWAFEKHNIFPDPEGVQMGSVDISVTGKKTTIDGTEIRADVQVKIVTRKLDIEFISRAKLTNSSWFCGPM